MSKYLKKSVKKVVLTANRNQASTRIGKSRNLRKLKTNKLTKGVLRRVLSRKLRVKSGGGGYTIIGREQANQKLLDQIKILVDEKSELNEDIGSIRGAMLNAEANQDGIKPKITAIEKVKDQVKKVIAQMANGIKNLIRFQISEQTSYAVIYSKLIVLNPQTQNLLQNSIEYEDIKINSEMNKIQINQALTNLEALLQQQKSLKTQYDNVIKKGPLRIRELQNRIVPIDSEIKQKLDEIERNKKRIQDIKDETERIASANQAVLKALGKSDNYVQKLKDKEATEIKKADALADRREAERIARKTNKTQASLEGAKAGFFSWKSTKDLEKARKTYLEQKLKYKTELNKRINAFQVKVTNLRGLTNSAVKPNEIASSIGFIPVGEKLVLNMDGMSKDAKKNKLFILQSSYTLLDGYIKNFFALEQELVREKQKENTDVYTSNLFPESEVADLQQTISDSFDKIFNQAKQLSDEYVARNQKYLILMNDIIRSLKQDELGVNNLTSGIPSSSSSTTTTPNIVANVSSTIASITPTISSMNYGAVESAVSNLLSLQTQVLETQNVTDNIKQEQLKTIRDTLIALQEQELVLIQKLPNGDSDKINFLATIAARATQQSTMNITPSEKARLKAIAREATNTTTKITEGDATKQAQADAAASAAAAAGAALAPAGANDTQTSRLNRINREISALQTKIFTPDGYNLEGTDYYNSTISTIDFQTTVEGLLAINDLISLTNQKFINLIETERLNLNKFYTLKYGQLKNIKQLEMEREQILTKIKENTALARAREAKIIARTTRLNTIESLLKTELTSVEVYKIIDELKQLKIQLSDNKNTINGSKIEHLLTTFETKETQLALEASRAAAAAAALLASRESLRDGLKKKAESHNQAAINAIADLTLIEHTTSSEYLKKINITKYNTEIANLTQEERKLVRDTYREKMTQLTSDEAAKQQRQKAAAEADGTITGYRQSASQKAQNNTRIESVISSISSEPQTVDGLKANRGVLEKLSARLTDDYKPNDTASTIGDLKGVITQKIGVLEAAHGQVQQRQKETEQTMFKALPEELKTMVSEFATITTEDDLLIAFNAAIIYANSSKRNTNSQANDIATINYFNTKRKRELAEKKRNNASRKQALNNSAARQAAEKEFKDNVASLQAQIKALEKVNVSQLINLDEISEYLQGINELLGNDLLKKTIEQTLTTKPDINIKYADQPEIIEIKNDLLTLQKNFNAQLIKVGSQGAITASAEAKRKANLEREQKELNAERASAAVAAASQINTTAARRATARRETAPLVPPKLSATNAEKAAEAAEEATRALESAVVQMDYFELEGNLNQQEIEKVDKLKIAIKNAIEASQAANDAASKARSESEVDAAKKAEVAAAATLKAINAARKKLTEADAKLKRITAPPASPPAEPAAASPAEAAVAVPPASPPPPAATPPPASPPTPAETPPPAAPETAAPPPSPETAAQSVRELAATFERRPITKLNVNTPEGIARVAALKNKLIQFKRIDPSTNEGKYAIAELESGRVPEGLLSDYPAAAFNADFATMSRHQQELEEQTAAREDEFEKLRVAERRASGEAQTTNENTGSPNAAIYNTLEQHAARKAALSGGGSRTSMRKQKKITKKRTNPKNSKHSKNNDNRKVNKRSTKKISKRH